MLQSQRDTTRLCAKYIEPRQAKPFSSYSQEELRFRMMQLDCPRELVAPTLPAKPKEIRPTPMQDDFYAAMEPGKKYLTQDMREMMGAHRKSVSSCLNRMHEFGRVTKEKDEAGRCWWCRIEGRATA